MTTKLHSIYTFIILMFFAATVNAQEDITDQYLTNADLSEVNYGWTYYSDYYKYTAWLTGSSTESAAVEFYAGWASLENTDFKFSQTITLPAGDYRIAVNAFYREGNDGNGTNANKAWIFAGEKKQNVYALKAMSDLSQWYGSSDMRRAMAAFKDGAFSNAFDFSLDAETEIELGFQGCFDDIRQWCILGPVQLYTYNLDAYLVDYRTKVNEAKALYNKKMGKTELAALKAAVVDESTFKTASDVSAALSTLNSAITTANLSIDGYAQLTEAFATGEASKAGSSATAQANYDDEIADILSDYNNNTVADLAAALTTVNAAIYKLIADGYNTEYANYLATYTFNKSSLIPSIASWDGNLVSNSGQHWDGTSYSIYYEQTGSQWGQYSWTNYSSTSLTLPAGKYLVMVAGRAASGSDVEAYMQLDDTKVIFPNNGDVGFGVDVNGVGTMSPDAYYANNNLGRGWEYRYIAFESDGTTPVELTLGGDATANHQWMSFTQPILLAQSSDDSEIIQFEDSSVKTLCVTNWDTDEDGELSKTEAAAVTSLGEIFKNKYNITSFKELQYFINLTTIEDGTFNNCQTLKSIIIPRSISTISAKAFSYCIGLTSIIVDANNKTYDSRNNCNAIIETSSNKLIAGCKATTIPNNITTIAQYAFKNCIFAKTPTLPSTIKKIDQYAFSECQGLNNLSLPEGLEEIGEWAFSGSDIQSLYIPSTLKWLHDLAFDNCSDLTQISVSNNNTKFDSRDNCNAIIQTSNNKLIRGSNNTIIPNGITQLDWSAFNGLTSLKKLVIPEGVTDLGDYTFYGCSALEEISIPSTVQSDGIGQFTFFDCTSLRVIRSYIKTPFALSTKYVGPFYANDSSLGDKVYSSAILYVPAGTKSLYAATAGWNLFANIVEMDAPEETITVTADNKSKTYGDANPTLTYTTSGGTLSGTPTLTCSAKKASDVGTYPIVISKGSVTNSQVNYVNGTLTVTKAPLTITVNSAVKRVGAANPTFTVTYSGFKNGETEASLTQKPTITCNATTSSAAGNYSIVASGATAKNYEITYVNGTLTVTNESPATVTAESYIRVYGEDNPDFDYFSDATNLGGEPKITCEATKTSPVGTYPIVITKGSVTNANVTYVNGTLTITKAPLKVSVGNYSRNYGEDNPAFTVTYSGFKNGDTEASLTKKPTATCAAIATSAVGSYSIIVSGGESTNYSFSYTNGTLSVKALSTDVFTVNDMTFQLSSTTAKTVKFLRGPNVEECEVPATVTYNNTISCSVTDIADGAFANQESLKSVKIPSSIKTVGKDLFAGSPHLAAITWDTSVKMTKEMAGSVTNNPNLLFYTPDTSKALDGMTNVINTKTNRAARIVLADAARGNDFFCPIEFTADEITYTHEYKLYTETGKCQGWESIALPFEVKEITHEKNGIIVPFGSLQRGYEFKEDNRPFWLYEYTTRGTFAEAEGIKANVPYIISMPNEYKLWEGYIHKGMVTFKGSNTAVKASSAAKIVKSGNRSFTPNYQNGTSDTAYLLNITDSYDGYPKGSVFVKANLLERKARPFEAYFDLGQNAGIKAYFGIFEQMMDDIRTIKLERPTHNGDIGSMYDLSGRKITKPTKGVAIINGKILMVK